MLFDCVVERRQQVRSAVLWGLTSSKESSWGDFATWVCPPPSQCLSMEKAGWTRGLEEKSPQASELGSLITFCITVNSRRKPNHKKWRKNSAC